MRPHLPPRSRRPRRSHAAAVLAALASAATLAAPLPASAAEVVVTGTVLDPDGQPAAGVLVATLAADELWASPPSVDDPSRQVLTDEDGRYELRAPGGPYLVRACPTAEVEEPSCQAPEEDPPYLRAYVGGGGQTTSWVAQEALLRPTGAARTLDPITLEETSRLHGRLTNANVNPDDPRRAPELVVLRRLDGTQVGFRFLESEEYDFTGLAPGQYRVESFLTQLSGRRYRSEVVTLGEGEDRRLDATLGRPAYVTGRLTDAGRGVGRHQVAVLRGGTEVARTLTDERGGYRLTVAEPGAYTVRAVGDDSAYLDARSPAVTVAAGATVRRDLAVRRGAVVTMRVVDHGGTRVVHRLRDARGRSVRAGVEEGRTVRYEGLPTGRYTATAVRGGRYAQRTFTVTDLGRRELGLVLPRQRTLVLRGVTTPGSVVEVADRRDVGDERFGWYGDDLVVADRKGRYRVTGVVPGEYAATVRPPGEASVAPRVVDRIAVRRDVVRDLPLPAGGVVRGRLVRADGSPFEVPLAVEAVHLGENRRLQYRFDLSRPDGAFAVTALLPGPVLATTNVSEGAQHDYWEVGSPYYLRHDEVRVDVRAGRVHDVGDVRLTVAGGPPVRDDRPGIS